VLCLAAAVVLLPRPGHADDPAVLRRLALTAYAGNATWQDQEDAARALEWSRDPQVSNILVELARAGAVRPKAILPALATNGGPEALAFVRERWEVIKEKPGDTAERFMIAATLCRLGVSDHVEMVVTAAASPDLETALAGLSALALVDTPRSRDILLRIAETGDTHFRGPAAAFALGRMDPKGYEPLMRSLDGRFEDGVYESVYGYPIQWTPEEREAQWRSELAWLCDSATPLADRFKVLKRLEQVGEPWVSQGVLDAIRAGRVGVFPALRALARNGGPEALSQVREYLDSLERTTGPNPSLDNLERLLLAAASLARLGDDSRLGLVLARLDDPEPWTRGAAAEALGLVDRPAVRERLVTLLRTDPEPKARLGALAALRELGQPDLRNIVEDQVKLGRLPKSELERKE
jgi:hypothetical protein